jgi:hypothetical protein
MAFPNAFTNAVDGVTTVAAALINQLETKVGVNNSTDPNSLEYKVNHLLSSLTGIILPFGATTPPTGFLLCDGSAVSRTTYAILFEVIGTTYGVGNGSTTFNVPDLRNRVPVGKAASGERSTLGAVGGALSHHHTGGLHSHAITVIGSAVGGDTYSGSPGCTETGGEYNTTESSGLDPYQVVNYIIKY